MADGQSTTQSKSSGSVAASQPEVERPPLLVSPSISEEFNTIRSNLIPNACFSLEDSHFEFDSSFVLPMGLTFDAGPLKDLLDKHPGFKLSVFGHTDPAGKDDFNKVLSGRRAQAVFGLLVRDVKLWEDLYFHHDTQGRDKWGVRAVQAMLNFAGPTKAGAVDGKLGTNTRNALKDFESAQNLPLKGFNAKEEIDPGTFRVLTPLYMDAICLDDDGNKFQLTPDDFIARGVGKDGKGDFQGCGEFNPLMMFSSEERKFFDKDANKPQRNKENQPNRRIMILLYRPGTRVDPAKWPCPSVKEGVAGCILRFHSNSKDRRSNLDERREHKEEKDRPDMVGTFACRFYDRQTNGSPCEGPPPPPPLQEVNPLIILGTGARPSASAIRDAGITGRSFVIVKRPYTKPARVPVTLKSDRPFEGTGEFTILDNSNLRFFSESDNLLAIRFDGVGNVFTGEQLTAGVTVFAEGIKASRAVDDITLTLTLSPKLATIATVARVQMTAVDVTLDICAPRTSPGADPVPLPQPTTATPPPGTPSDKLFGGRFVRLQDAKKTQERAMLIVRLRPADFSTTLELTTSQNTISLFNAENPASAGAALTFPLPITSDTISGNGRRFFVQGDTPSKKLRDVELQLGIQGVEPDCDRVAVTVTPAIDIILDSNDDHVVDQNEPVARFVRVGLWDRAFDSATGNLHNDAAEATNFVGADTRRFYFRVHDPGSSGEVRVRWKTTTGSGANDDAPASQQATCIETGAGSGFFVSRAAMVVTDTIDQQQTTNSGLPTGNADAGNRNFGQSNHRTRKIIVNDTNKLASKVVLEYTPASGVAPLPVSVPLFNRSPEDRKKIKVHLVNIRNTVGGTGILSAARKTAGIAQMRSVYAACGIFMEVDEITLDPPASCIGWATKYPTAAAAGIAADPAVESAAFTGGNLVPSASQTAIINVVRGLSSFDPNDLYVVYVSRIYANPVPAPPAALPGPQLQIGPGGISFPDSFTAAGSIARSFTFVGVTTVNVLADAHEMTHVTTDLRNSAGGHFHLQATVGAGPGVIDGKNLMQRFVLISTGAVSDSKRLWDEPFTNAGITPSAIPAQVTAIRGSRFIKPL